MGKKNAVYKIGTLGRIFRHQILAGDLKAARKTQEIVQDLMDNTTDEAVKLNGNGIINASHFEFARLQARSGDTREALKTAEAIDNLMVRTHVIGVIAVEQAKRKEALPFLGAKHWIFCERTITCPTIFPGKIENRADNPHLKTEEPARISRGPCSRWPRSTVCGKRR